MDAEEPRNDGIVLGAGASRDAGYPLADSMAEKLLGWMKRPVRDPNSYAARYPAVAQFLEGTFSPVKNIEDLITAIRTHIKEFENGTQEQRTKRAKLASAYGVLQNAVRDWFAEIQSGPALDSSAYRDFASHIVAEDDCIITFNYDVSLERELRRAGKFKLAAKYGTPLYVYSQATLLHHLKQIADGLRGSVAADLLQHQDQRQHASVPAHGRARARASTSPAAANSIAPSRPAATGDKIVFAGVGKTDAEIRTALENDVLLFNVESEGELHAHRPTWPEGMDRVAPVRPARQSRPAAQDARQDRHQRQGRQVRTRHRHHPGIRPEGGRPSARRRSSGCTCISARRSCRQSRIGRGSRKGWC